MPPFVVRFGTLQRRWAIWLTDERGTSGASRSAGRALFRVSRVRDLAGRLAPDAMRRKHRAIVIQRQSQLLRAYNMRPDEVSRDHQGQHDQPVRQRAHRDVMQLVPGKIGGDGYGRSRVSPPFASTEPARSSFGHWNGAGSDIESDTRSQRFAH